MAEKEVVGYFLPYIETPPEKAREVVEWLSQGTKPLEPLDVLYDYGVFSCLECLEHFEEGDTYEVTSDWVFLEEPPECQHCGKKLKVKVITTEGEEEKRMELWKTLKKLIKEG